MREKTRTIRRLFFAHFAAVPTHAMSHLPAAASPAPNSAARSVRRQRGARSPEASYLIHRAACPAVLTEEGSEWRALAPAGKSALIHEWHIPAKHTTEQHVAETMVSLMLHSGAGLMQWFDAGQKIQSALVPGDVLQLPAGTQLRFTGCATDAAVFIVTGRIVRVVID